SGVVHQSLHHSKTLALFLFSVYCNQLLGFRLKTKAENKIWHSHPVWFLDGNPIVGYSKQKKGIRLMFWSGADFDEQHLNISKVYRASQLAQLY
ncbi:MAG: hypothetical protein ACKO96_35905, partial [Flammeovirgaceae bacterium]